MPVPALLRQGVSEQQVREVAEKATLYINKGLGEWRGMGGWGRLRLVQSVLGGAGGPGLGAACAWACAYSGAGEPGLGKKGQGWVGPRLEPLFEGPVGRQQ